MRLLSLVSCVFVLFLSGCSGSGTVGAATGNSGGNEGGAQRLAAVFGNCYKQH
jgi:hypothetical protein